MKAVLSTSPGGPETLIVANTARATAGPGELLIRVKACAVNYPDVLIIEDRYQFKPQRPFSPGCEVAGVVEDIGAGVAGWAKGDRAIGTTIYGGMAEYVAIAEHAAFRLPEHRDYIEGAALLLTYATAMHALVDRGRIRPDEKLLVLGAAGGVGLAAVELGRALGACVIGGVSSEAKARAAREAGANDVFLYSSDFLDSRQLTEEIKAAVGETGAHVICDCVGGDYALSAIRSISSEGRYLVVGFPAGVPKLPLNLVLLKSCDVLGIFWGAFATREPLRNRANVQYLFGLWDEGRIAPKISAVFPFENAGDAIAELAARRVIGKVVVVVD